MSILTITEVLLHVITEVQETFIIVYRVSLVVGYYIAIGLLKTYKAICALVFCLGEIAKVLHEDFDIFKSDLVSSVLFLFQYINESVSKCVSSLTATFLNAFNAISEVISILSTIFQLHSYEFMLEIYVKRPLHLIFDALCLIGITSHRILEIIWTFLLNIPHVPQQGFKCIKSKSMTIGQYVYLMFTHEAVFGILVVSCLGFSGYRFKVHKKLWTACKKLCFSLLKLIVEYVNAFVLLLCIALPRLRKMKFGIGWPSEEALCQFNRDELQKQLEKEKAEKMCIICMDNKRNAMLLNCKHLVLCDDCAYMIVENSHLCPVCRSFIIEVITVYT